jgi:hypothetical protein
MIFQQKVAKLQVVAKSSLCYHEAKALATDPKPSYMTFLSWARVGL